MLFLYHLKTLENECFQGEREGRGGFSKYEKISNYFFVKGKHPFSLFLGEQIFLTWKFTKLTRLPNQNRTNKSRISKHVGSLLLGYARIKKAGDWINGKGITQHDWYFRCCTKLHRHRGPTIYCWEHELYQKMLYCFNALSQSVLVEDHQ